jgi:hypothetical protein
MSKVGVIVFFDHRDNYIYGDLKIPEKSGFLTLTRFSFEESATYEEMVGDLIQEGRLLPLDDQRLRYNLVLQASEVFWSSDIPLLPRDLSKPVTLREGQTLESTNLTHLVMDESVFKRSTSQKRVSALFCAISVELLEDSQFKGEPTSTSPNLGQITVGSVLGFLIGETANVASIISLLDSIERRWRERHTTRHNHPQQGTPNLTETDIVAIRLRMTHGPDHEFVEWITEPDRLKHYIDAFSQPSSSIKPLQAIFVQRNDKALHVDVSEGTQNNRPLDTLLSYLNIDLKKK